MRSESSTNAGRRRFLLAAGATVAGIALAGRPLPARAAPGMKIGIIGAGHVGGTLGELWAAAGHPVLLSSRHPDELAGLVARIGTLARAGTPADAAAFGEAMLISVPYKALPQIGRDYAAAMKGKVVLDTCNPFPGRDGEMAVAAREKGSGIASAEYLPGVRLVRAFNCVGYGSLRSEAHRAGEKVAIPLAGDDAAALDVAKQLVVDAGFEPVVVGGLESAREFDPGTAVFGRALTVRELRSALGLGG